MTLEEEFHQEMLSGVQFLKKEHRYHAPRYVQMVHAQGGLAAAKSLLANPKSQTGLHQLRLLDCLDYSMEVAVLKPKYRSLFDDQERDIAKRRLKELGYDTSIRKARHD